MAQTIPFLQLSQEFGGTRFGPFLNPEIRLGSDPGRNDITLPESLGIASEHVKLLRQQDSSFILAPVERGAAVFLWKPGAARPRAIQAPVAIGPGDGFSLGTAEGPRFILVVEADRAAAADKAKDSQGPGARALAPNLNAGGIFNEIKRVGLARALTTKAGSSLMKAWTFIRTGQFLSPIYVVMAMMTFSGWVMAGGLSCAAFSFRSGQNDLQQQLTSCKDQLGVGQDESDPTVAGLTEKVLADRAWKATLQNDKKFSEAYAQALKNILAAPDRYKWVYSNPGSEFVRFQKALEGSGLPDALVRVLAYAAARPNVDREWWEVMDSEEKEACGRGPLGLTYRQAYRLGLLELQPDAWVERRLAASNDLARQRDALQQTVDAADASVSFQDSQIRSAGAQLQGGAECLYIDGADDRTDVGELATALADKLGPSAKGLPREQETFWVAARLTLLYAFDFRRGHEDLDFRGSKGPSTVMELADIKASRTDYALREAAAIVARAVAIPCLASLDKEVRNNPPAYLGELPNLGHCAIIKAFVEYDQI